MQKQRKSKTQIKTEKLQQFSTIINAGNPSESEKAQLTSLTEWLLSRNDRDALLQELLVMIKPEHAQLTIDVLHREAASVQLEASDGEVLIGIPFVIPFSLTTQKKQQTSIAKKGLFFQLSGDGIDFAGLFRKHGLLKHPEDSICVAEIACSLEVISSLTFWIKIKDAFFIDPMLIETINFGRDHIAVSSHSEIQKEEMRYMVGYVITNMSNYAQATEMFNNPKIPNKTLKKIEDFVDHGLKRGNKSFLKAFVEMFNQSISSRYKDFFSHYIVSISASNPLCIFDAIGLGIIDNFRVRFQSFVVAQVLKSNEHLGIALANVNNGQSTLFAAFVYKRGQTEQIAKFVMPNNLVYVDHTLLVKVAKDIIIDVVQNFAVAFMDIEVIEGNIFEESLPKHRISDVKTFLGAVFEHH
jgi:hypothetical protein